MTIIHDPAGAFAIRPGVAYRVIEEHGALVVRPIGTGWRRSPTTVPGTKAKKLAYQLVTVDPVLGLTGPVAREEIPHRLVTAREGP
jgi:hypothetical protein